MDSQLPSEERYAVTTTRVGVEVHLTIIDKLNGAIVATSTYSNINRVEQFVSLANKAWKEIKP